MNRITGIPRLFLGEPTPDGMFDKLAEQSAGMALDASHKDNDLDGFVQVTQVKTVSPTSSNDPCDTSILPIVE